MSTPGLVVRLHGKDKSKVDVQFKDKTVTASNIIKDLKVGDYVVLEGDLIIQKLSEKQAEKFL
ncbi:MAG: HypC/HybG/HupF family hydrogenase formation chaperone [Candidatus Woesearchaeota archaeon]